MIRQWMIVKIIDLYFFNNKYSNGMDHMLTVDDSTVYSSLFVIQYICICSSKINISGNSFKYNRIFVYLFSNVYICFPCSYSVIHLFMTDFAGPSNS